MSNYYVPDFSVKIEGLTLAADVTQAVIDLTYDNDAENADMFSLQLNNADLSLTDSALFDVGKKVEIYLGYVGDLHPMMLGEITSVSPNFPQNGAPTLTVTGYDKSHRMRHNTPDRFTFRYMNDSVIAAIIAAENLLLPMVDPAPTPIRESVQQTGSDWAFLKELAERNFFQVYVHWDKLYFRFPRPQTDMVVLEWGKNLNSFTPRLSTSGQFGIQEIRSYDYKLAQNIVSILPAISLGSDFDDLVERLGSSFIDQLVSLGRHVVRDQPASNFLEAAALAKAILMQLLQGLYEGSGTCIGLPQLRAGDQVEIRGLGKRFSGRYTLSKVVHTVNAGGYQTRFEVTQKFSTSLLSSLRRKIAETPSPNRQERLHGVVVGKVENNVDPEQLGRVQLSFPHLSDVNLSNWARVCTPMAGNNRGLYFLPEINDEVLVTFVQGDINNPVVIGSLWNGRARPPELNTGQNTRKVMKTGSGMKIIFDETPTRETLTLEDKAGSVITMSSPGGDISIRARGNVTIEAGPSGDVTIRSGAGGKINLN